NFDLSLAIDRAVPMYFYDVNTGLGAVTALSPSPAGSQRVNILLLPASSNQVDSDADGLTVDAEHAFGTFDFDFDSDNDGLSDLAEVLSGTDPLGGRTLPAGIVGA